MNFSMDRKGEDRLSLTDSLLRLGNSEIETSSENSLFPVAKFWSDVNKKEKTLPWLRITDSDRSRKKLNLGPGGAAGIGCGAGIGLALVGGAGVGAWPWNNLRFVFGVGFGCGIGIGYGFGHGIGILWDRPPQKVSNAKRVVIEI